MSAKTPAPRRPRRGRPPADRAGEVEARVLDAAAGLFFTQGFGRTTMDQVIEAASTSKSTLYGRYPTKRDLFAAVVTRATAVTTAPLVPDLTAATPRERLLSAGERLAAVTLTPAAVALMRTTAAEALTFPDIAHDGFTVGFEALVRCAAASIAGSTSDDAIAGATPAATVFVEVAFHPLFMHAFYGADLAALRARVPRSLRQAADAALSDSGGNRGV